MSFPTPSELFQPLTRKRKGGGDFVNGRWVNGTPEADVVVTASLQPANHTELLRLPEGLRTRGAIVIFTDGDLRTANESLNQEADRVVHQGEEWEIVKLDDYTMPQLTHGEFMAVRADRAGAAIP